MDNITLSQLEGGCPDQCALFAKTFPAGAPLTVQSVDRALAAPLDVGWLIRLLPASQRIEYYRTTARAKTDFDAAIALAQVEYDRSIALAQPDNYWPDSTLAQPDDYWPDWTPARAERQDAVKRAEAELARARALALLPFLRAL